MTPSPRHPCTPCKAAFGPRLPLTGALLLLPLLAISGQFGSTACAVEIIAHRGASYDAPENTLAAVRLGWEQASDGVEIDVHLSADGRIVVIHDYDTKKVAGVPAKVVAQTFAELRALEVGAWKDPQWEGEPIPSLDEVLATIPAGKQLFVEIKCGPEILPEFERVWRASGKSAEQLVIIAFSYEVSKQAKARFPSIPVYWIYDWKKDKDTGGRFTPDDLLARAKAAGLDGVDVKFDGPVTREFVEQAKSLGLEVYVWTVDDPLVARTLADAGVKGITTNRPGWLREQLKPPAE
jgi:glycerophosphoryl diester phosphodiesterase